MSDVSNLTTTNAPLWETSNNHGPLVSVITWFLAITTFLAVLARVATRYAVIRQVRRDEVFIVIALIFGIGQSTATSIQASSGLGRHIATVSPGSLTQFEKSTYASGFLYIGALSIVKISVCLHLNSLTPIVLQRQLILCVGAFVCLWMVSCFFVLAFQCQLPHPWEFLKGRCINITGFWTYVHVINILTDLALTVLPWMILSNLQLKTSRKAIVIGCFSARVVVIAATVVQIYFLQSRAGSSQDLTFDLWTVVLLSSIVQALSFITACIPYLKPFMSALETGMIRADRGAPSALPSFVYGNRSTKDYLKYGDTSKPMSKAQLTDVRMSKLGFTGVKKLGDHGQTTTVTSKVPSPDSDNDSQTSQSKIIRKTVGWSVTEEHHIPPNTHLEYPSRTEIARAI